MKKAFFLDRDGVINVEIGYLHEAEKTELLPDVAESVKMIHRNGFMAIVVSNQAGVAKGYYPEACVHEVHSRIQRLLLESGGQEALIDAWYYCVHHPDYNCRCSCRKPAPGMILQAAEAFDIDLRNSFMIGDRITDLEAGKNGGCAGCCLVETGEGRNHLEAARRAGFFSAASLSEAVKLLLGQGKR